MSLAQLRIDARLPEPIYRQIFDQVVAGIALNLLAIGGTRFFLRYAFDSSSNSPRVPGFGGESGGATGVLATLAASAENPLVWIGLLVIPATAWLLYRTPFGLRIRAVGEKPEAARSLGVPVARVRVMGVACAGALALAKPVPAALCVSLYGAGRALMVVWPRRRADDPTAAV